MKVLEFDDEARAEYGQAIDYYQARRLGLGQEFYDEAERQGRTSVRL